MSDLFSPITLPDRPVQQLADIAEREWSAKQKGIDTRSHERMETTRLQSIHEIGVAKEDYRKTLEELAQEYRKKALSQPTQTYSRGSSSRGRSMTSARQQASSQQIYYMEAGRLSTQLNRGKLQVKMLANWFSRAWAEQGWDDKEAWDIWQERLSGVVDTMRYSTNEDLAAVTLKNQVAFNNALYTFESGIVEDRFKAVKKHDAYNLNKDTQENLITASGLYANASPEDDVMGLGAKYFEDSAWPDLEAIFDGQRGVIGDKSYLTKNSIPWGIMRSAFQERLARGVVLETMASRQRAKGVPSMAWMSLDDHIDGAMGKAVQSAFFDSVNDKNLWDIDDADIRGEVDERLGEAIANDKAADRAAESAFYLRERTGDNDDLSDADWQRMVTSFGEDPEKAYKMTTTRSRRLQDERVIAALEGTRASEEAQAIIEQHREQAWSHIEEAIRSRPELLDNPEDLRLEFQRLEGIGVIGPGESEQWESYLKKGNVALLRMYDPTRDRISGFITLIEQDERVQRQGGLPTMTSGGGARRYTDGWKALLTRELNAEILEGDDGKRWTPESMDERTARRLLLLAETMDLTDDTKEKLFGMTPTRDAQPMEAWAIQPVPGIAQFFSRSVMEKSDASEATMAEYEALAPELRSGYAVNQIRLQGYRGNSDDDAADNSMRAHLRELKNGGSIRDFQLSRDERTVYVQLADNGQWHFRSLDFAAEGETLADMAGAVTNGHDLAEELGGALGKGRASLTYTTSDEWTGDVEEHGTVGAELLVKAGENVVRTAVNWAKSIEPLTIDWEAAAELEGIMSRNYQSRMPHTIRSAGRSTANYGGMGLFGAGEMFGLRPWHTE